MCPQPISFLRFLKEQKVRYDYIIFGAGRGERILINDKKRDGLLTAHAINTDRDTFCQLDFIMDVHPLIPGENLL